MNLRLSTAIVIKNILQFPNGFWVLLIILLGMFSSACSSQKQLSVEEQAQQINKMLICPVCPAETIDQSQVPLALNMREVVRNKLNEGWTTEQILDYFSSDERYGPVVLSAPPKKGFTLTVWLVPPISFIIASVLLGLSIRTMSKRRTLDTDNTENKPIKSYLELIDLEIKGRYMRLNITDNGDVSVDDISHSKGNSIGEIDG